MAMPQQAGCHLLTSRVNNYSKHMSVTLFNESNAYDFFNNRTIK
jgi:hypothetical protein